MECLCLIALFLAGLRFELGMYYNASLLVAAGLFGYQQRMIKERSPQACFRAFKHNNWVGLVLFISVVVDYALANQG